MHEFSWKQVGTDNSRMYEPAVVSMEGYTIKTVTIEKKIDKDVALYITSSANSTNFSVYQHGCMPLTLATVLHTAFDSQQIYLRTIF